MYNPDWKVEIQSYPAFGAVPAKTIIRVFNPDGIFFHIPVLNNQLIVHDTTTKLLLERVVAKGGFGV